MNFWCSINEWFDRIIFPKSDTSERKFQKKLDIHQIVASAVIALGTSLIGLGFVFYSFGLSLLPQLISETQTKNENNVGLESFIDMTINRGDSIIVAGFLVLFFGVFYMIIEIVRQK